MQYTFEVIADPMPDSSELIEITVRSGEDYVIGAGYKERVVDDTLNLIKSLLIYKLDIDNELDLIKSKDSK